MALDLWFRDEVRRILDAAYQSIHDFGSDPAELAGADKALRVVATAFGLPEPGSMQRVDAYIVRE